MMTAAVLVPLLLGLSLAFFRLRRWGMALAPFAALPALLAAWQPDIELFRPWVLLGARLGGRDDVTRTFLLLTGGLWLAAGLFARSYQAKKERPAAFWGFFLVSLAGNVGVVLAQDVASFYALFALMTYAVYGLVIHERSEASFFAGRVYFVMALLGEALLLLGLLLLVGVEVNLPLSSVPHALRGSPHRELITLCLLVGFGLKVGVVPLHVWLPLAHPVAPTPASAVLSGAILKAGVVGWLRFVLPAAGEPSWLGTAVLALGVVSMFYGVLVGVTQREPKSLLAYSSVSQLGVVTVALGMALSHPALAPALVPAIGVYALHHAWVKGTLFLGTGLRGARSPLVAVGLFVAALDISGAPFTAGARAKEVLKHALVAGPELTWLGVLLSLGAVGTTVLLARFLVLMRSEEETRAVPWGQWGPWVLLLTATLALVWMPAPEASSKLLSLSGIWDAAWPVVTGGGIAWGAARILKGARTGTVPPGDLLSLVLPVARTLARSYTSPELRVAKPPSQMGPAAGLQRWVAAMSAIEERLQAASNLTPLIFVWWLLFAWVLFRG